VAHAHAPPPLRANPRAFDFFEKFWSNSPLCFEIDWYIKWLCDNDSLFIKLRNLAVNLMFFTVKAVVNKAMDDLDLASEKQRILAQVGLYRDVTNDQNRLCN